MLMKVSHVALLQICSFFFPKPRHSAKSLFTLQRNNNPSIFSATYVIVLGKPAPSSIPVQVHARENDVAAVVPGMLQCTRAVWCGPRTKRVSGTLPSLFLHPFHHPTFHPSFHPFLHPSLHPSLHPCPHPLMHHSVLQAPLQPSALVFHCHTSQLPSLQSTLPGSLPPPLANITPFSPALLVVCLRGRMSR